MNRFVVRRNKQLSEIFQRRESIYLPMTVQGDSLVAFPNVGIGLGIQVHGGIYIYFCMVVHIEKQLF